MADIVTLSLRIGARTMARWILPWGRWSICGVSVRNNSRFKFRSQEQIDAMKAKTGLQHLTVINQSRQQYLQKDLPDLFVDLSTVGEGYAADHRALLMEQEGISAIWCRWAAR